MDTLDKITQESLDRYFSVLEQTGYVNNNHVNNLILLSFLSDFLNQFQGYITEADYNKIDQIINCLSGKSCMIPYREYIAQNKPLTGYILNIPFRLTQDTIVRQTEIELREVPRLVNQ